MFLTSLKSKPILLANNTIGLYNQDSIEVLDHYGPGVFKLIVTDPPYLMAYVTNMRKEKNPEEGTIEHMLQAKIGNDTGDAGRVFIRRYFQRCYNALEEDTAMYCFCKMDGANGEDLLGFFKNEAKEAGFKVANTIIWKKNNWSPGDLTGAFAFQYEPILFLHKGRPLLRGRRHADVWEFGRVSNAQRIHPNQKPVDLLVRAIESSSDEGDLVFDGCAGSGSLAIAAYQVGRRAMLCEYDSETPQRFQHMVDHISKSVERPLLF